MDDFGVYLREKDRMQRWFGDVVAGMVRYRGVGRTRLERLWAVLPRFEKVPQSQGQ